MQYVKTTDKQLFKISLDWALKNLEQPMKTEVQVIEAEDISQFDRGKMKLLQNNTVLKVANVVEIHPKLRQSLLTICSDFAVQNINPYCKPACFIKNMSDILHSQS